MLIALLSQAKPQTPAQQPILDPRLLAMARKMLDDQSWKIPREKSKDPWKNPIWTTPGVDNSGVQFFPLGQASERYLINYFDQHATLAYETLDAPVCSPIPRAVQITFLIVEE